MAILFMMIGIPGAGKTTRAKTLASIYHCTIACPDHFRAQFSPTHDEADQSVSKQAWEATRKLIVAELKKGNNVILDATNIYRRGRKSISELAPAGTKIIAVRIKVDLSTAIERNKNRDRHVPEDVIIRMYNNLEEPSISEGFYKIIKIN